MTQVFYLIALLLLPLSMRQLVSDGQIKLLLHNGLPSQDTDDQDNS